MNRYNSIVISKAEWVARQQQWAELHRWERAQPPEEYSPEEALEALSALLEWIPESVRAREQDPERRGVQRMHALLRLLSVK